MPREVQNARPGLSVLEIALIELNREPNDQEPHLLRFGPNNIGIRVIQLLLHDSTPW